MNPFVSTSPTFSAFVVDDFLVALGSGYFGCGTGALFLDLVANDLLLLGRFVCPAWEIEFISRAKATSIVSMCLSVTCDPEQPPPPSSANLLGGPDLLENFWS